MKRALLVASLFVGCFAASTAEAALAPPANLHVTATTQSTISVAWSGSVKRYAVWLDGRALTRVNAKAYTYNLACSTSHTLGVRSVQGNQVSAIVTITAQTSACTQPPPPPTGLLTVASASCTSRSTCTPPAGIQTTDCAITPAAEVHTANTTPNHTTGDGTYTWGSEVDPAYWHEWGIVLPQVQGQFTGTTDEHFQWAACRWGFAPDLFRAAGVQETDWRQGFIGDNCGPTGQASYGIIQIKNRYCNGSLAWGGYPDTQQSTALAVDFYGAYLRACSDGAFYDGGAWLYNGQTVGQVAAAHGWDYVVWGCVGSWFSGGWNDSGATSYIASVKQHLANRDWETYP